MKAALVLALILVSLLTAPQVCLSGEAPPVAAKLSVVRNSIYVGDHVTLNVEVTSPPKLHYELPKPEEFLKDFEVLNSKPPVTQEKEGSQCTIHQYDITSFTTGSKKIGPLLVKYTDPLSGKKEMQQVKSNEETITVLSVLPKDEKNLDIKDIKPPIQVNYPLSYWIVGIIAAFLIILALYLIVRLIKKKMREKAGGSEREKTPEEIAEERLRLLSESSLLSERKIKDYYSELSEIIRQYLENRHEVSAPDRTTTELFRDLKASRIEQSLVGAVKNLLSLCDLVKFAKFIPEERRYEEDFRETRRIYEALRPAPQVRDEAEKATREVHR
jgi:hypothetical protein